MLVIVGQEILDNPFRDFVGIGALLEGEEIVRCVPEVGIDAVEGIVSSVGVSEPLLQVLQVRRAWLWEI